MKNEELDDQVEFEQVVTYRDRVSNVTAKGKRLSLIHI